MPSNNIIEITVVVNDNTGPGVSSASNKANVLQGIFQGIGQKAAGLVAELPGQVIGFFKSAIDSASDLGETVSKNQTIFGNASKELLTWADNAPKALGMTKQAALDATGQLGNMFTQLGISTDKARDLSKANVQLAADFASFHNADPTDVLEAISSAYRGEYDAVQRFVPTITAERVEREALAATHKKSKDALTDQDKALAVNAILMKDAGAAAGDFARTSDSAANQSRIAGAMFEDLKVKIGNGLLPIWTALLSFITGTFLPGIMSLSDRLTPLWNLFQIGADAIKLFIGTFTGQGADTSAAFPPELINRIIDIGAAARQLADTVGPVLTSALTTMKDVGATAWDWLSGKTELIEGVAIAIGTVLVAAVIAYTASMTAAAVATVAATWPFLLIIAIIAALVAAFLWAFNNVQWFRDGFLGSIAILAAVVPPLFETIRAAIQVAVDWIVAVAVPWLMNAFNSFIGFLQGTLLPAVQVVWNGFVTATQIAVNIVRPIIDFLVGFIQDNFSHIAEIASNIWDMIKNIISNAWQIISNLIQFQLNIISGHWGAAWDNIKNILSAAWDTIKNVVSNSLGIVRELLQGLLSFIGSLAGRIGEGLINAGRALIEGLWHGVQDRIGWVKDQISGALGAVRNLFPFSPAKEGPFSGRGWVRYSGRAISDEFARGMTSRVEVVRRAATNLMETARPDGPVSFADQVAMATAAAPASVVHNWYVEGSIRSDRDLVRLMRDEYTNLGLQSPARTPA